MYMHAHVHTLSYLQLEQVESRHSNALLVLVSGQVHTSLAPTQTPTDASKHQVQPLKGGRGKVQTERKSLAQRDTLMLAECKTLHKYRNGNQCTTNQFWEKETLYL